MNYTDVNRSTIWRFFFALRTIIVILFFSIILGNCLSHSLFAVELYIHKCVTEVR